MQMDDVHDTTTDHAGSTAGTGATSGGVRMRARKAALDAARQLSHKRAYPC